MDRIFFGLALGIILVVQTSLAQSSVPSPVPSDPEIRKILVDRIDRDHQSVGIVIGIIDPAGRRIVAYGSLAKDDKRPLDGDTVFEIGSITKVFTSLLLSDMVQRGEVVLTDPVAKYLPPEVKVPERGGKEITLEDLATHTSGLPRMPTNFAPKDQANPYADYSVEQMYQFISGYQLTRDIGSQYEYSNLGGGLLGHALARRAGMSYEELVESRICQPLGMKSTEITLTPELKARLAVGHNQALEPVANWDIPTLAGAGALRSTANDLLIFLAANLGYTKTPLAPAMAAMLKVRRPTGMPNVAVALAWHITTRDGEELIWHNGGTGGYRTYIGFDPKKGIGVVALSNTSTGTGVDDIGQHLLDSSIPLVTPPKPHTEVAVDPKIFDGYVGRYALTPSFILTITREGDHLFTQATGQSKFEVFPGSKNDFFYKVVDAQITFQSDAQGKASGLILHQNGRNLPAKRMEGDAPPAEPVRGHKEISIDPKLLDGYVGRYQLAPNFILTVTREGDQLFVQATGQPTAPVFPESEKNFFYKVVDAQISFETDDQGRASALVLHQNGMDQRAPRQ